MNYNQNSNSVKIYVVDSQSVSTLMYSNLKGLAGANSASISTLPLGGQYKVKICDVNICDLSDSYFTITSGTSSVQPSITVLSSNGGESYR